MSVSTVAIAIRDLLSDWTTQRGGQCSIVSNFRAMWDQASQSSQKPIVLICYLGERVRGPFSTAAATYRVDRTWNVAVVRGRGFASVRGDTLSESVGGMDPFYNDVEAIRDMIREANYLSAEEPVDYKSIRPMQLGTLIIDGYLIEFSTAHDL